MISRKLGWVLNPSTTPDHPPSLILPKAKSSYGVIGCKPIKAGACEVDVTSEFANAPKELRRNGDGLYEICLYAAKRSPTR